MPESVSREPLVWVDCEMTGLDRDNDSIMQIACFVTDYDLDVLDEDGFEAVIHHSKERLDQMDDWCTSHHAASGLTAACIESTTSADDAAKGLLQYVQLHAPDPRRALLAGNSVHADAAFLRKPPYDVVLRHLHHRILDVSTIKEAARRWVPREVLAKSPQKKGLHEAREDILESIREAKFYRDVIFQNAKLPEAVAIEGK
ncbi:ribonuclease H-like protein [Rhizodiscina lignyota]|uniref:Ribonuclease H-like protein n=1 Tax=Rhizodiscina lignyota TaxID=1504668 RepID=A0A9P4IAI5_9PEZI|nr:ribonuclease H-like protein [Rhizodiscina lignyota]